MLEMTTILLAAACLIIGAIIGALLTRTLSAREKQQRDLAEQLRARDNELQLYKHDVANHLLKSAEMISELKAQQQQVSEQFLNDVARLAPLELDQQIREKLRHEDDDHRGQIIPSTPREAPVDYALNYPEEILGETYGLADTGYIAPQNAGVLRGTAANPGDQTIEGQSTPRRGAEHSPQRPIVN